MGGGYILKFLYFISNNITYKKKYTYKIRHGVLRLNFQINNKNIV